MTNQINSMMKTVEHRIEELAIIRAGNTRGFCATRMQEWDGRVRMWRRLITVEYNSLPDDQKEQWLNDKEAAG